MRGDFFRSVRMLPAGMSGAHQLDPESLGDHIDRLYRAAWSLCGSRADAEDLVQETFAHVLRRPRLVRSDDDIGYLLRALRNTYIAGRRRALRRPAEVSLPDDLDLVPDPSAAQPQARLEANELYAAIATLPDDLRDAVIAIDVVGLSYREASRSLKVREATLATRLHRARKRLADMLK
jgi:RNA polymerase sigma-70 factor, ECF subfamily